MAIDPHSDVAGTGLDELVAPCPKSLRAAAPPPVANGERPIAVAFSGGGFRASLAALGVLRFLDDAGLLDRLRYVSSVSGGSVTAGLLATRWDDVVSTSVDEALIDPFVQQISTKSLRTTLLWNLWRTLGPMNRTDLLAREFDKWWFGETEIEHLSDEVRWIINAANETSGTRFGFERDRVGDYVTGYVRPAGSGIRVAQAVAASAAVPGPFSPMSLPDLPFGCLEERGRPRLVDGGAYDNTGLTALDEPSFRDVLTVALNAGGAFKVGAMGKIPIIRNLKRANSMLYRQSTGLRTEGMVRRFQEWEAVRDGRRDEATSAARPGALFALATTFSGRQGNGEQWQSTFVEYRTWKHDGVERDLAFVPTSFNSFDAGLCRRLIYRGWWATGMALASYHPELFDIGSLPEPPPHR